MALVPDDFDPITDLEFGQIVEGVEGAEGAGPGNVAETVSGEDDGECVIFRGAEVGNAPDAGFEDFGPVFAFMDFTPDTDFLDDEAIFLRQGGVKVGQLRGWWGWEGDAGRKSRGGGDGGSLTDGIADGGRENFGCTGGEAVEDVRPDRSGDEDDG